MHMFYRLKQYYDVTLGKNTISYYEAECQINSYWSLMVAYTFKNILYELYFSDILVLTIFGLGL